MSHTFKTGPLWVLVASLGVVAAVVAIKAQPPLVVAQQPKPSTPVQPAPSSPSAPATAQPAAQPKGTEGVRLHGIAEPIKRPEPRGSTLRLATYNIENLFDDKDDPQLSGRYEDASMTKPEPHCVAVAEAIRKIDADVLAVQEIESKDALLWFRDRHLKGLGYDHVVSLDAGDERGIEQAVLSRYPIKDVKQWVREELGGTHPEKFGREENAFAGKPITFHRSPLRVTIEAPAKDEKGNAIPGKTYELTIFNVHLKSGGPGGYWREREATGIAKHIKEFQAAKPGANIVVLGDFNAQLSEPSMKVLVTDPSGPKLKDAFDDRPARDKTIQTHSSGRVIDHLLFTSDAWKEVVLDTRFVLGTITRPEGVDWRNTPAPTGWAADHYPVVVDVWLHDK